MPGRKVKAHIWRLRWIKEHLLRVANISDNNKSVKFVYLYKYCTRFVYCSTSTTSAAPIYVIRKLIFSLYKSSSRSFILSSKISSIKHSFLPKYHHRKSNHSFIVQTLIAYHFFRLSTRRHALPSKRHELLVYQQYTAATLDELPVSNYNRNEEF